MEEALLVAVARDLDTRWPVEFINLFDNARVVRMVTARHNPAVSE